MFTTNRGWVKISKAGDVMKEATDKNFESEVLKCKYPVFACFTADWCRPCYPTCLLATELVEKYRDKVKFVKVNIDKNPELSTRYHIIPLPTILIFRDSQTVKKLVGFQNKKSLKRLIDSVIVEKELPKTGGLSQVWPVS